VTPEVWYNILLTFALVISVVFVLLVFLTGKGDAMSGGTSSIRTTFKGKASFEDQISKMTLYLGSGFMVTMLLLDIVAKLKK
jgi:preprotein translocase subunit SecG